jgi:hypothetical protein
MVSGLVAGHLAIGGEAIGRRRAGLVHIRRLANRIEALLGDAGNADPVALVASQDMTAAGILADVQAHVTAALAHKDEDVAQLRLAALDTEARPA